MRAVYILLTLVLAAASSAGARAQVSSGKLQSARIASGGTVDVQTAPAAVTLQIVATSQVGLSAIRFALISPSHHQTIAGEQVLVGDPTSFNGFVQTRPGGGGMGPHGLNLYSEAGIWSLTRIDVCDTFGLCARTSGAALAALLGPTTVTVTNHALPVSQLPHVETATILTPTVAESMLFPGDFAVPAFHVSVSATAGAPGIVQAQARFAPPANPPCSGVSTAPVVVRTPALSVPTRSYSATLSSAAMGCFNASSLAGVYTLDRLIVADQAGNVLDIDDPVRLSKLFPAGKTVTVTAPTQ